MLPVRSASQTEANLQYRSRRFRLPLPWRCASINLAVGARRSMKGGVGFVFVFTQISTTFLLLFSHIIAYYTFKADSGGRPQWWSLNLQHWSFTTRWQWNIRDTESQPWDNILPSITDCSHTFKVTFSTFHFLWLSCILICLHLTLNSLIITVRGSVSEALIVHIGDLVVQ